MMGHATITKPNASGVSKTSTIYGWWARDFYTLRSKVVYEGTVSKNDLVNAKAAQRLSLALRRLKFCFVRLLEQRGLLHFKVLRGACFGPFAGFSCERHNLTTNLGVSKRYFSMLGTARF